MYIIIKDREHNIKRLKGKNISEFARNLESNGWPSEFANDEIKDKVKYAEKKSSRPITKKEVNKIAKDICGKVECGRC